MIDTKFSSILARGRFDDAKLKSRYLYQMYAYVRSQEGRDLLWDSAAGLFLHPAVDGRLHEHVVVQNHPITFVTVDLCMSAATIRNELRAILLGRPSQSDSLTSEIASPAWINPAQTTEA